MGQGVRSSLYFTAARKTIQHGKADWSPNLPPPRTRAAELERDRRNGERVPGGVLARPTMVKRSGGDAGVMPGDGAGT